MRINNDTLYNGTVAGNLTTGAYDLSHMTILSLSAVFSGGLSPNGSIKLQGCNDNGKNGNQLTNWFDITMPVTSVTAVTGDGNVSWNYSNIGYRWVRVVYTRTSGSANVVVQVNSKGF